MSESGITCVVVDDHSIVAEGVSFRLQRFDKVSVVGMAATGEEGLEMLDELKPDIALVDFRLPGIDGLQLVELAIERKLPTRHIVFSAATGRKMVDRAFRAGAHGFISKTSPSYTVEHAIQHVAEGRHYCDPTFAGDMLRPSEVPLSKREEEVLTLLGEGLSNKRIAEKLGLTPETVKTHVTKVMHKLEATNRTEAVIKAFRTALII